MSRIVVRHEHTLDHTDARARVEHFESFMGKYGAKLIWDGDKADLKGPGVSGGIILGSGWVEVTVKLGMLARAAGVDPVRLESSIAKRLSGAFAEGGPTL